MRSIKTMLLAAVAALAMVALLAPAAASANEPVWTDNGVPITEPKSLSLQGTLGFGSGSGGVECAVVGVATLVNNDNIGWIGLGNIDPKGCKGTGARAFCTVSSVTIDQGFWFFAAGGPGGMGTGTYVTVKFKEGAFCPAKEDVYGGGHWMNMDNGTGMNYWSPTGSVSSSQTGTATIYGKYNLTPAGRYGLAFP
jgi:hypothetical protein